MLWITSGRHWETPGFPPVTSDEMLATIRETGADGVDCHFDPGVATEEAIAAVHGAGFEFHVWTVNTVDEAAEALRRGADTVTTDYADRIRRGLEASAGRSFTFATWNIGHYSCGRTYPSDIPPEEMADRVARYSAFLDRADASVVGVCEDSWFCDPAGTKTARETIFGRYAGAANEETRPFDYNSLYWSGAECVETGRVVFPQAADTRFYRWAKLRIAGRKVVVVEAHLDWNITPPGHGDDRRLQIRQLIDDFKDEPCVVIGGDFQPRSGDLQPRSGDLTPHRGVMSPGGDMSESDFRTLADWGATLLRFQMVRDWHGVDGNRDLAEYDRWLEGRLDHVDKVVLPLALQYGLRVVLDLHVPPGGRDAGAEANLFYEPAFAEHFVELWRNIARRFRGRYGFYGYDLLNEPCHKREPLPMDNVVYEVHFYEPFEFTHQRVLGTRPWTEPWPNPEKGWDRAFLEKALKPVRDFQRKHGARIYVGEFSAICWAPGAENYLRDCIGIFRDHGWDWTYHAFREWPGWSVEHEGEDDASLRPSADNPRKRALLEALGR